MAPPHTNTPPAKPPTLSSHWDSACSNTASCSRADRSPLPLQTKIKNPRRLSAYKQSFQQTYLQKRFLIIFGGFLKIFCHWNFTVIKSVTPPNQGVTLWCYFKPSWGPIVTSVNGLFKFYVTTSVQQELSTVPKAVSKFLFLFFLTLRRLWNFFFQISLMVCSK